MARKHRFFNTYLTATVSVSLVLFLIGLECVLGLSANDLFRRIKENVSVSVVLSDATTADDTTRLVNLFHASSFCHSYQYISKDDALQEHITNLGEDPTEFLGYNPISASYEIKLEADYTHPDSVLLIDELISTYPFVESVQYQKDMVSLLDANVSRLSIILLAIAAMLLVVSLALVVNTVRLHVYAKRFIIHTMQLVGATSWVIKRPLVRKAVLMGVIAAVLAILYLAATIFYSYHQLGFFLFPLSWQNITFLCGVVLLSGILLTFFASSFAVNRYIRMNQDDLYSI